LAALLGKLRQLGVRILERATVEEIVVASGRATGVRTTERALRADAVVVANYAWIVPLLKTAGLSVPAKTFVHQRYVSAPQPTPFVAPPVNADPFLGYIRPADGNCILIGAETPDRDDVKVGNFAFRLDELSDGPEVLLDVVARFGDFVPGLDK